jgi:hypothetical protein
MNQCKLNGSVYKLYVKVLQRWVMYGAWAERTYISYNCLTSALEVGEWSVSRTFCDLHPEKNGPVSTLQKAVWAKQSA